MNGFLHPTGPTPHLLSRTGVRESTQPSYPWGMIVREMLRQLQHFPQDEEVLAFEAGCKEYCKREVDEVEWQGDRIYLHLGVRRDERGNARQSAGSRGVHPLA
jgi:hypothetical protein